MAIIDKISDKKMNISDLYRKVKQNEIFIDNSFQRRYVWEEKHQIALIETILLGYNIPALYFWEQVPDESGHISMSVVDGQQRLGAICDYIDEKFYLKKSALVDKSKHSWIGKNFSDLSNDEKIKIWSYNFDIKSLKSDVNKDEIKTLFLRLNYTNKSLNPQELRNAKYDGKFLKLALKLSENSFWAKYKIFSINDIRRMIDVEFVSNLLIFLRHGFKVSLGQNVLNKTYDLYNNEYSEATEDEDKFIEIIGLLDRLFDFCKLDEIHKTTHLYTLFAIEYKLLFEDYYGKQKDEINVIIKDFYEVYANSDSKDPLVEAYRSASQEAVKSLKNREIRYNSLLSYIIDRIN